MTVGGCCYSAVGADCDDYLDTGIHYGKRVGSGIVGFGTDSGTGCENFVDLGIRFCSPVGFGTGDVCLTGLGIEFDDPGNGFVGLGTELDDPGTGFADSGTGCAC